MPPILFTALPFQIALIIHAIKSGRSTMWVWVLLIGSWIGVIAYVAVELLPGLMNSRGVRRAASGVLDAVAPERRLKAIRDKLELAPTVGNRVALANECLRLNDFATAETVFREGLSGFYASDPDLLLGMAQALFGQSRFAEAQSTLEALIAANPQFRSPEGHLLFARCLEEQGHNDKALAEYAVVSESFPGEEARVRYARLLKRQGQSDKARSVLEESLRRARLAPPYYRRAQKAWLSEAERDLRGL
jgi:hypothetical protein